ncbi:MAG: D-erythrose-4-phosphate dehydrogenase [Legionellaceae bacterium]
MTIRVAINGYGRIGRNILRALYESHNKQFITIVAINDTGSIETNVHLTKYDTTHGRFSGEVSIIDNDMLINNEDHIRVFSERNPENLPWKALNVDVVYECTGQFTSKEKAMAHIKVIISAPGDKDIDTTIVYGINHQQLKKSDIIISNASCTTNCLAPVVKPLYETVGLEQGLMVTIHAYTNDQMLLDGNHKDLRRARSATQSMIPTKTGAAKAIGLVLPELVGKLDGYAVRVPTINVSMIDLTFQAKRNTSVEEINQILQQASQKELKGILAYNTEPLVSIDFNHHPASAIFDATETKVIGNLVKVIAWYDNEWGFSNRMLDTTLALMQAN